MSLGVILSLCSLCRFFSWSVVLSSPHFILSLPLFSDVQAAQGFPNPLPCPVITKSYPCFTLGFSVIRVFSAPVPPLCLRNFSVSTGKLTNPYFFKFLQPYFLTFKTPSNHSEYKYSHFTGARQYIPESRDELLFWYDPIQNFRITPAFSVLFTPSLHSHKVSS